METLTCSRVGPVVEGSIGQLVDMVKQVGRTGNMTESQNRRMVTYLGNLDDMRDQIVIMVQRYEEDGKVLKRLLDLLDRIDDVKQLAMKAEESIGDDAIFIPDQEIVKQYDTPFNPLMVSTLNILDVSGLFASQIKDKELEEEEEEEEEEGEGDDYWDHKDDPTMLAPEEKIQDESSINLSVSSIFLPSLFDSSSTIQPPPPPPLPPRYNKGKGKVKCEEGKGKGKGEEGKGRVRKGRSKVSFEQTTMNNPTSTDSNPAPLFENAAAVSDTAGVDRKGKGKAREDSKKAKKAVKFRRSASSSSTSEESSSEEEVNGAEMPIKPTIGWRRTLPSGMNPSSSAHASASSSSSAHAHASSSSSRPSNSTSSPSSSSSQSGSESESESSFSGSDQELGALISSIKRMNKGSSKKGKPMIGPMAEPVLCKICYDEYDRWEKVQKFDECGHIYCKECLADYLTTNINEGAVLDLECPFPNCETEVSPDHIKNLCAHETVSKYEKFTVLASLRADPNARWCPNPFCNNGIKHNASTMPWVNCTACKYEFCFHCMAERHDGAACGREALDFLQKKKESEELALTQFEEWTGAMHTLVKPCPACKAYIEKNDGCNHMTCGNPTCRAQFCWLCVNLYTDEHFIDEMNFPNCYDKQYWSPPNENPYVGAVAIRPRRRFANIAKKVGIYMGVGVAVVTLGVPAAVIGGPVYGCFRLHKRLKRSRARRDVPHHHNPDWVPPSPARIAEAAREARRLYDLEHS